MSHGLYVYRRPIRGLLLALAFGLLATGLGFCLQAEVVVQIWPWPDAPLSHLFIGSIMMAEGAAIAWTAATLDLDAARGGALGFAAMSVGISVLMFWLYAERQEWLLLLWAVGCAGLAAGSTLLFIIGGRWPVPPRQPAPAYIRGSFLVLATALFVAAAMLLARLPVVFPWPLVPESSTMFGLYFLASGAFFFDGWLRPSLANTRPQLLGFLVYDVILIPPYLRLWTTATGGFRVSLALFLAVLISSALLAVWFFVTRGVRLTR